MNVRVKTWTLAGVMVVALFLAMAQRTQAHPLGGPLPPYKEPTSAKFDVSGSETLKEDSPSGNQDTTVQIVGSGAISGNNYRLDATFNVPSSGGAGQVKFSQIVVGDNVYSKTTDPSSGQVSQKWQVQDASSRPGGAKGTLLGNGFGLTGPDPKYSEAFDATQMGSEKIDGVSTTKYQVVVDYETLAGLLNTEAPSGVEMTFIMWVGDSDKYVHRLAQMESLSSEGLSIEIQLTYNFKEFNVPVTISAPPASEVEGEAGGPVVSPPPGMPGGMPAGMPVGMPAGMPAGMPRTGASNSGGSLPWALASLSVLLIAGGGIVRRRTSAIRIHKDS